MYEFEINMQEVANEVVGTALKMTKSGEINSVTEFRAAARNIIEKYIKKKINDLKFELLSQKSQKRLAEFLLSDEFQKNVDKVERTLWDNVNKNGEFEKTLREQFHSLSVLNTNLTGTILSKDSLEMQRNKLVKERDGLIKDRGLIKKALRTNDPVLADRLLSKYAVTSLPDSSTTAEIEETMSDSYQLNEILNKHIQKLNNKELYFQTTALQLDGLDFHEGGHLIKSVLQRINKELVKLEKWLIRTKFYSRQEAMKWLIDTDPLLDELYNANNAIHAAHSFMQRTMPSSQSKNDKHEYQSLRSLMKRTGKRIDVVWAGINNEIKKMETMFGLSRRG